MNVGKGKFVRLQNLGPNIPFRRDYSNGKSCVYFIQDLFSRRIKIGTAKCFNTRFKSLQASTGSPLSVLLLVEGDRKLELLYHDEFNQNRIHGEWFQPTMKMIRRILKIRDKELFWWGYEKFGDEVFEWED